MDSSSAPCSSPSRGSVGRAFLPGSRRPRPTSRHGAQRVSRSPVCLFGHSVGGLIAYELARTLCSSSRPPNHVFVSGQPAPHLPSRTTPRHALPQRAFEAVLAQLGGMPPEILRDAEVMAVLVPLLRADLSLAETYAYEPGGALDIPMTVFGGDNDPEANRAELEAWRMHSRDFRGVRLFPGNHFYLRDNPAEVVRAVGAELIAIQ